MDQSPLSVSELTADIKHLLEQRFANVRVCGEVSRLTTHHSGHLYFTIKDAGASITAVVWRSTAARLNNLPKEQGQFIFSGHLSLYEPQGRYQLVVQSVESTGEGQLAAEFERRKQAFFARGWFDAAKKLPIPALPNHIAIITSPTTAALQDVKKILNTRPSWIKKTLITCIVQGAQAPATIVAAFDALKKMEDIPPVDVVLLVRGGGSMEDLWCFNDERVVQAVVDCTIPVISGIGHEIDTTLTDLAADVRAATPSNAAEIAAPDCESLRKRMPRLQMLAQFLQPRIAQARRHLRLQTNQLEHRWRLAQDDRHHQLERIEQRLLQQKKERLQSHRQRIITLSEKLEALNPKRVLARGYSITMNNNGRVISNSGDLMLEEQVHVHFHEGSAWATITKITDPESVQ
ncbi:MAG: exodeoxyribonuclease VII large subunit [Zetaproteobacteria bacterium]|nr:exodeoxyribonuclease VII large subunit [Zetaproteobacteria bacterium]